VEFSKRITVQAERSAKAFKFILDPATMISECLMGRFLYNTFNLYDLTLHKYSKCGNLRGR